MSQPPRPNVDTYGFEWPRDFNHEQYNEFMSKYVTVLSRRARKWEKLLNSKEGFHKTNKVKRYVRKGIPGSHRAVVWSLISGAKDMKDQNPDLYSTILKGPMKQEVIETIDLDIPRTFPDNIYFKNASTDSKLEPLKRVLLAFAHQNPKIGYCQGLNFIAGIMLLVTDSEDMTFWLLQGLKERILPDYYTKEMTGLLTDIGVLEELIKFAMEKVLLLLSALLVSARTVTSQCITANDIIVNETSIGTATHNLIEGSTRFSLELLRTLNANQRGNKDSSGLFFSPHSIWSALMVTYMGARGATEQEMKSVLGVGDTDKPTTWEAFRNIRNFNPYKLADSKEASYNSANRIYFQEGTTFKNCMREMLNNDIEFLDFRTKADEARELINTWVEKQTQQRIKDLIPPEGVDALTNMIIANAVYFKEAWLQPFEPQRTARRRFITSYRREIFVDMMTTKGRFLYGKSEELQCYAIEMPYTGNTLSMTIMLPNNRYSGVDNLANKLTPERLRNLLADMYPREVLVSIPKFKMEDSFELSTALNKMGLRTLFDPRHVDLSGFTGIREFTVDAVHHKAFIDVNEEGTEAAAATAVISSRSARPIGPAAFIADYPFIYFIRDNLSNAILFLGTVQKPPETGRN